MFIKYTCSISVLTIHKPYISSDFSQVLYKF
jgi:hypothetical protein